MSVDPVTVAGTGGGAGADALIAAELDALAADAQALAQLVAVGDVVTATVLPSNGLGDVLNILGNRVAAALPPTLVPGEVITAQVTGFDGTQILLQVLATHQPVAPAAPASAGATASAPAPPAPGASLAPPVAVFVAGTVRPNAPAPLPIPPGAGAAEPAPDEPPGAIPGAAGMTLVTPAFGGIEARLAAARAAAVTVLAPPAATRSGPALPPAPSPSPPPAAAPVAAPAPVPAPGAGAIGTGRPFVPPPPITPSPFVESAPAAANAGSGAAPARPVAIYQDPVTLVRALQLPVTPTNVAAARIALASPERLPAALATLERALPQGDDPRVATYRTIAAFVGKIEPASPQLATQIAAYVEHVVAGSEPALAQLLVARAAAAPAAVAEPAAPTLALAQIVERGANLASSLKEQLFSLLAGAPANAGDDVLPAAASALTAVTAVQLVAAQAAAASPATIAFAIPMSLGASGYVQARVAVDRDAPDARGVALDGDNFHIAFVLDTKHLGTVAIDLRTVGRAFSLSVRTEHVRSAQRFGDELSRLTDRLATLRYRAAAVEAVVAAPAAASAAAPVVAAAAARGAAGTGVNERA